MVAYAGERCVEEVARVPPHYFTREDVNRLIPRLAELIPQIREARRLLIERERALGRVVAQPPQTNGFRIEQENQANALKVEADTTMAQFRALAQEIADMGAELKDPESGLVDFLALRNGREVYLCWREGEPDCAWWHDLDTGFAGRQPLP